MTIEIDFPTNNLKINDFLLKKILLKYWKAQRSPFYSTLKNIKTVLFNFHSNKIKNSYSHFHLKNNNKIKTAWSNNCPPKALEPGRGGTRTQSAVLNCKSSDLNITCSWIL